MEIIRVDIAFNSEFSVTPPEVSVFNDGQLVYDRIEIEGPVTITFDITAEPGDHVLEIRRDGHDQSNHQICKLISIHTDGIEVTEITQFALFYPQYPMPWFQEQQAAGVHWPESHAAWKEWGWNGLWRLNYRSPFYTWLLNSI